MILNLSSFVGRLVAGFAGQTFGVATVSSISVGCCAAVALGMIGVKDVAGIVVVGIVFGFFWGICEKSSSC